MAEVAAELIWDSRKGGKRRCRKQEQTVSTLESHL